MKRMKYWRLAAIGLTLVAALALTPAPGLAMVIPTEITLGGTPLFGSLAGNFSAPGEIDGYSFTVPAGQGGTWSVWTDMPVATGHVQLDLDLYAADMSTFLAGASDCTVEGCNLDHVAGHNRVDFELVENTTYFVMASCMSIPGASGDYAVRVKSPDVDTAVPITVAKKKFAAGQADGASRWNNEARWFSFVVPTGYKKLWSIAAINPAPAEGKAHLELWNANRTTLLKASPATGDSRIVIKGLKAGATFFVKVRQAAPATNTGFSYTLDIQGPVIVTFNKRLEKLTNGKSGQMTFFITGIGQDNFLEGSKPHIWWGYDHEKGYGAGTGISGGFDCELRTYKFKVDDAYGDNVSEDRYNSNMWNRAKVFRVIMKWGLKKGTTVEGIGFTVRDAFTNQFYASMWIDAALPEKMDVGIGWPPWLRSGVPGMSYSGITWPPAYAPSPGSQQ
jgi:hypothetical protein